ncbi:MAG: hypothetical protein HY216_15175 [Candidatus Rokubacteria bacterium]|nr:hypothetical protein [Candidatus Rokubacteria bacterium]
MRHAALWTLILAKLVGGWGLAWDIRWHLLIGRDSFWIAPHLMTYASVVVAALVSLGVLLDETWRRRPGPPAGDTIAVFGLRGTPGFHLAWWGMCVTILAAPLDDLWHRVFGLDVTLWSPPHLLGVGGAQINTLGCLLIATELWPREGRARGAALVISGAFLLGLFGIVTDQAVQTAYRHGGVRFFAWAVLGSALFAFTLVLLAEVTGWRSAPLVVTLVALAMHTLNMVVADVGFALVQPSSALAGVIAADPTSPVAIAHEMARLNGTAPGRSWLLRLLPVLPAALLTLIDARRRTFTAAAAFGVALLVASGLLFFRLPAFARVLPDLSAMAAALVVTIVAALAGAAGAVGVARPFGAR